MPSAATSLVASVLLSVYQIYSIYITYEVSYNGRTSYVSNYFCCRIQSNWKNLCYAERDLTAIAAFLVCFGQIYYTDRLEIFSGQSLSYWIRSTIHPALVTR